MLAVLQICLHFPVGLQGDEDAFLSEASSTARPGLWRLRWTFSGRSCCRHPWSGGAGKSM